MARAKSKAANGDGQQSIFYFFLLAPSLLRVHSLTLHLFACLLLSSATRLILFAMTNHLSHFSNRDKKGTPKSSLPVWMTSQEIRRFQLLPPSQKSGVHGYVFFDGMIYEIPDPLKAFPARGPLQHTLLTFSSFRERTAQLPIRLLRVQFFDRVKYRRGVTHSRTTPTTKRKTKKMLRNVQEIED